ncbi:MAG: hypothetical protein AB7O38_15540 [Pirellulaceae bacterium]
MSSGESEFRPAHVIRLRGPWRWEAQGSAVKAEGEAALTGPIPIDWRAVWGTRFAGRIRACRAFGRPTGLSPGDRVDLVIESGGWAGVAELNGQYLARVTAEEGLARVGVRELLAPRNQLMIEISLPDPDRAVSDWLDFNVRLEIGEA